MKYEIVVMEDNSIRLGKHIGTVFERKDYGVELKNFGLMVGTGETYYNSNIHLPKKLVNYFENNIINDKLIEEMLSIGIYPFEEVDKLIFEYNQKDIQKRLIKKRIENLTKKN